MKLRATGETSVAILVVAIDTLSDVESIDAEIETEFLAATGCLQVFAISREAAAFETTAEVNAWRASLGNEVDDAADRVCAVDRRTGATQDFHAIECDGHEIRK